MAFGLGAGACFYYVTLEDASPSRWFNGRTARLEENFDELTGAALEMRTFEEGDEGAWEAARASRRRGRAGPPPHRPLLPGPLRQLGPLPRPRRGPRRLRRGGRPPLRHRLRGAAEDRAREPRPGPPQQPPRLSALRPHVHRRRRQPHPRAPARNDPGGDRAGGAGDGRARVPRLLRPRRGRAARRGGRILARGRRGLAVVRALRLPGDRAPGHRRRRLPVDVFALPGGGGTAGGAARRRGRGSAGPSSRRHSTRRARARTPSRPSGARSTAPRGASSRPSSASGPRWPPSFARRLAHHVFHVTRGKRDEDAGEAGTRRL